MRGAWPWLASHKAFSLIISIFTSSLAVSGLKPNVLWALKDLILIVGGFIITLDTVFSVFKG